MKEIENKEKEIEFLKNENNFLKITKENNEKSTQIKIDMLKNKKKNYKSLALHHEMNCNSICKEMQARKIHMENWNQKMNE